MFRRLSALSLVVLFALVVIPASAQQATPAPTAIVVTNPNCDGPGSLKQAINDAASGATITFAVRGTVCLTVAEIDKDLTITGPGPKSSDLVIGGHGARIFDALQTKLNLKMLTLAGAYSLDGGAVVVLPQSQVTLTDVTVRDNTTEQGTSAITNEGGNVTITNSTFYNNRVIWTGGPAIANDFSPNGEITITNSTVLVDATVMPDTLARNSGLGGGTIVINRSTIAVIDSKPDPNDVHFSNDVAILGGRVVLQNTIVAGVSDTRNCVGGSNIQDGLYNLQFPGTSCGSTIPVGDPKLGPLQDNGGPTWTMMPQPGSAAIGKLSGTLCPASDQRGFALSASSAGNPVTCDIGAYQTSGSPVAPHASVPTVSPTAAASQ